MELFHNQVTKAQEMARLVRRLQPGAGIVLGGPGAAIEGVEQLIPCDHVVKGEGIRWLRQHLGEDPDRPLVHPSIPSSDHKRVFGIPFSGKGALLVPGVGCVNGCRFCATSHFFGKACACFAHAPDSVSLIDDENGIVGIFEPYKGMQVGLIAVH